MVLFEIRIGLYCADYALFPAYYAMLKFFTNLPIMLSDFPIMLRGFTYYAQILNEKYNFKMKTHDIMINAGALALQMAV